MASPPLWAASALGASEEAEGTVSLVCSPEGLHPSGPNGSLQRPSTGDRKKKKAGGGGFSMGGFNVLHS